VTGSPDSTAEAVKDQAKSVAEDAKQGGQQVAATAMDQTREVAGEAKAQTKDLFRQARGEATDQAATQQRRAASGLHSLGDELGAMAGHSDASGIAGDLARQASDQAHSAASWLESREPGDVMSEITDFARRRPGTFLAAAAAIGFLGGRLTRGLAAGSTEDQGVASPAAATARPEPLEASLRPPPSTGADAAQPRHGLTGDALAQPQSAGMPGRS
jgi:hypothetical protein